MSDQGFQEKTEQPTPKRRKEAREKGQVAKSMEVGSVCVLMGALGVFFFCGAWMFMEMRNTMSSFLGGMGSIRIDTIGSSHYFMLSLFKRIIFILLPLFTTVIVMGLASNILQVGPLISLKPLSPKFSKLNPLSGIKRLVSLRSLVELIKSMIKISVIATVVYLTLRSEIKNIPSMMQLDVIDIISFIGISSLKISFYACMVFALIAILDFVFQKFEHEKDLKMTKQEVKEEAKQSEGDPKVKQRIKRAQMEMVRLRMLNTVPEATVIITNPTHFAIAVKFDFGQMPAPMVLAKGAGVLAARIKELAKENNVPIVENKPLAQLLFKTVDIGTYIPVELYQAVAEILAYIYRIQGRRK